MRLNIGTQKQLLINVFKTEIFFKGGMIQLGTPDLRSYLSSAPLETTPSVLSSKSSPWPVDLLNLHFILPSSPRHFMKRLTWQAETYFNIHRHTVYPVSHLCLSPALMSAISEIKSYLCSKMICKLEHKIIGVVRRLLFD